MHPPEVRAEAMRLVAAGINDCEISRRIGIPRSTIRDWRRPTYVPRESAPSRRPCPRCWRTHLSIYSSHLPCVFPQDGDGPKHKRVIALEPWQRELVNLAPWAFLRGCIRSDGCAFINRTGQYEYLSYAFSNMSDDIVQLFTGTCDRVGVGYRANQNRTGRWEVRINRRASVALMLKHVGLKE